MADKNRMSVPSLGGIARVNLLPPEVGERRQRQGRVRILVLLVVLAVVVVAGAYVGTRELATTAQTSLASAQAQSQSLLQQQGTYAKAKDANDSISQIDEALTVTTSSEVTWADLYGLIQKDLPSGARVTSAIFTGRAPFDGVLVPTSPISPPKVATIAVTVALDSPDDAATFMESVGAEDTVSGVTLSTLSGVSGQYLATFRVDFNAKALSQRFAGTGASK
jgi:type II secretory pathway pseudopilin PulG